MARNIIDIGVEGNDGTGDSIRESFRKTNENFRELYAVFGIGGQISFANLDDVPNDYTNNASKILAVNTNEDGIEFLELVSDGAVTGDPLDDTIKFNVTLGGKLLIQAGRTRVSGDPDPELAGHLNADGYGIGNIAITDTAASEFASKYGGNYTIHDLVPDKKYTDSRYAKAQLPGKMGGVRNEPADATEYTLTITGVTSTQDLQIVGHGLDHASNGNPYEYNTSNTNLTPLIDGTTYYVRVIDNNTLGLYTTQADAISPPDPDNSIAITGTLGASTHTIIDKNYDNTLEGFWLSNEVLPRKSVVRREGDKMTGALYAHDHPGALAGTPALAQDDLQVATKLYVDSAETSTATNLYVSTTGKDSYATTSPGKAGRSPSYAFRTIGAAARKAEELQIASKFELGNYAQTITYDGFKTPTTINSAGVQTIPAGRSNMKVLIDENKKFIQAETIAFINTTYPTFVYNQDICKRDVGLIVEAAKLDSLSGNNSNFLSRRAGIRYYANASATAARTTQKTETIAAIQFVKALTNLVLQNQSPASTYQSVYTQYQNTGYTTDTTTRNSIGAKFDIVVDLINDGSVFDAPAIVDGSVYELEIGNGTTNSFVDQGNPDNTDILPGKVVRGKQSGAIGRVIEYKSENLNPANPANTDILELQLLEPIEFTVGEELEYANEIKFDQISIRVESGNYEEDFPIRMPANVSLKGDEFRRVIVRPKNRSSQSPWANVYFYRDMEFDGLKGDATSVTGIADPNLPTGGTTYVNPLTGNPVGFFGRHYLTDPTTDVNVSNYAKTNPGGFTQAAKILENNEDYITEEVIAYVDANYANFTYNEAKCRRDIGLILDAIELDVALGTNYHSVTAGLAYQRAGSSYLQSNQKTQTVSAITKLKTDTLALSAVSGDATATARATAGFDEIIDIINNGVVSTDTAADALVFPTPTGASQDLVDAKDQLQANRAFLAADVVAYIQNTYPSLTFNSTKCNRDVKYIVDAISHDILYGGNVGTRTAAQAYFESSIQVPGQETETAAAIAHLATIVSNVVQGIGITKQTGNAESQDFGSGNATATEASTLDGLLQEIEDVITAGSISGLAAESLPSVTWAAAGVQAARSAILAAETTLENDTITYINTSLTFTYNKDKCRRDTRYIVRGIVSDLKTGGRSESLANQGAYYAGAVSGQETETADAIQYIATIVNGLFGANYTPLQTNEVEIVDPSLTAETNAFTNVDALVDLVAYAFNANINPPRNNKELDVFLCNDGTIIRNCSVTGHGGFMMVLDPDGQVLTKSPYCQTGSSFSGSLNRQAFRGGMLVDAFVGNTPMNVIGVTNAFNIQVESNADEGLFIRKPNVPAPFYIDGNRFQVNAVRDWDQVTGTATLVLDPSSNDGNGFAGTYYGSVNLSSASSGNPIEITVQTAGNRSMLGNDFTQVNDLGYGLVVTNGGLSEMVSQFTYYCWTAYYANNGGEIRSLNGSNAYGEYGLVSNGSDPNEIPDAVTLRDNMVKPAKSALAETVLEFSSPIVSLATAAKGDTVQQGGASGTVVFETAGKKLYLKDVTGTFSTSADVEIVGSPNVNIGTPDDVSNPALTLDIEQLSIYAYDFPTFPQGTAEVDILHSNGTKGRYEVTNVQKITDFRVDGHIDVAYTAVASGTGAKFDVQKVLSNFDSTGTGNYEVKIRAAGTGYGVGDTFTVDGTELDGTTSTHDCVITVDTVDSAGVITSISSTGSINELADTPHYDGQVYKLSFSNATAGYSNDGLITSMEENEFVTFRHNQTFVLDNLNDPNGIKTRPSTAFEFDERIGYTYRTTAFSTTETTGEQLPGAFQATMNIDSTYDYIRIIVDPTHTSDAITDPAFGGTTLGATKGDRGIAIEELTEVIDIARLRQGGHVFVWDGKTHRITDYIPRSGYAIVKFDDYMDAFSPSGYEDLNKTSNAPGLHSSVVLSGTQTNTIRCGLRAGSPGEVTVQISLCRATGHDFLDIGTGSYNTTNYPNVLLGDPRAPNQANEVQERSKGRVFYVSTDQDGFFRVGRFFTVDQGTGTVTFAGSIALSNLDGIGFKRGVVVAEFSTDDGMTQNGSDIVPTQNAIRGYVNRRLGWDHNGVAVSNIIGLGAVPRNGSLAMTGDFNAGGFRMTNVAAPQAGSDAANKTYVDTVGEAYNTIAGMRDFTFEKPASNTDPDNVFRTDQILHNTGYRILYIDTDTISDGPFYTGGRIQQGSNTGEVVAYDAVTDSVLGACARLVYLPLVGTFTGSGSLSEDAYYKNPAFTYGGTGTLAQVNIAKGTSYYVEIANPGSGYTALETFTILGSVLGGADGTNDATVTISTVDGSGAITGLSVAGTTGIIGVPTGDQVAGPYDETANATVDSNSQIEITGQRLANEYRVDYSIKDGSIYNADVNAAAAIAQSKLSMNAATTRANATGITQADLGLASFDSDDFSVTNGWVTLNSNAVDLADINQIGSFRALGNITGATANVAEVPITATGGNDSLVLTKSDGKIRTTGLIIGASDTYTILQPKTGAATTIQMLTPGGATIFEATGTSAITAEFAASIDIDNSGADVQSTLQQNSTFANAGRLSSDWIYSQFIEAANEKGTGSTGIAIGAGTGKTNAGEIGIVNKSGAATVVPFKFSATGVVPDVTTTYNIGSSTLKYNTVYAGTFDGTATKAKYADLAENYLADAEYEIGTVIMLGGAKEVTASLTKGDTRVFGVVSENPAYLMNSDLTGDYVTPVALTGRVKCKIIGKAKPGDMLIASSIPGYAMVDNNPKTGSVIGKVLEEKTSDDKGVVEIVVGKV